MSLRTRHSASPNPTPPSGSFALDLARARYDIAFFCRRFLGFTPHPGQIRLWEEASRRDGSGWRALYLTIFCSAGNRAGKTLALAVFIIHHSIYKVGLWVPDPLDDRDLERWMSMVFEAYHFAIQQETAELVYYEMVRLLSGLHEAQTRGCPLAEELGAPPFDWSKKYRGEYLWMRVHPLLGGADIHFRTTSERAIGSLGKDMHLITFDECAFDPHLQFIFDEVLDLRRLGTGGQFVLVSTPTEGINDFADLWSTGDPTNPLRRVDRMSVRMSTRDNIGYGIDEGIFNRIVADMPEYLIPQNIDGYFLEGRQAFFSSVAVDAAFVDGWEEEVPAINGHRYVNGVDPAITYDATWAIVLDATTEDVRGVAAAKRTGRQTALSVAALVTEKHRAYNVAGSSTCTTALDVTGMGGKVFRDLLGGLSPLISVEFGGTKQRKLRLLYDLKNLIETGRLKFPRSGIWLEVRRQLLGYKLEDRQLATDAVMALAVAVSQVMALGHNATPTVPFDYFTAQRGAVSSRRPPWLARRAVTFARAKVERGG